MKCHRSEVLLLKFKKRMNKKTTTATLFKMDVPSADAVLLS